MPVILRKAGFAHISLAFLLAVVFLAPAAMAGQAARPNATAPKGSIAGKLTVVANGSSSDLSGITVKLTGPAPATTTKTSVSDAGARFEFDQLAPGSYTLETAQTGFTAFSAMINVAVDQAVVRDIALQISTVNEQVEVKGEASAEVATQSVTPTGTVNNEQLDTLPLPEQKVTEALSLVPGVIRTAQGKLNFNGQAESQGMLLVDSAENVDPISGSFAIPIPVDAVEALTVFSLPQSSGYGGFSGGLTTIETRPPSGMWDYKFLDFIPSFRAKNDHLVGLANLTPRLQFGGPLIANKFNFSQEITYEFRKTPVRGLSWPVNETVTRSTTSFTQLQVIWSARHLLNASVNVFPVGIEYANINALVPQTASTTYHRGGVSAGLNDTYMFPSGAILSALARYTRFDTDSYGQGTADMQVSPSGWGGNFFNDSYRRANQLEAQPTYQLAPKSWHGQHEVRFGLDYLYRYYDGRSVNRPIQLLAADGTLAEQINFQGPGLLKASDWEASEFIEDRWNFTPRLTLSYGGRVTSQGLGRRATFAPRVGFAYAPGAGKTIFRASAAEVYSHVPLLAADFINNQERVLSFYNSSGIIIGAPEILQNAYLLAAQPNLPPGTQVNPGTSPRTFSWNAEFEHEVSPNLSFRVGYLDSHTYDLFVMDQILSPSGGSGVLGLRNTGGAHYHQAQATAHYHPNENMDLTVSYTWSRATGDLNTISDTFVPFAAPVIRPDVSGILPSDVPQRVLATGLVHLPWKLVFSPVVDIHSGLPYSNVDVQQNYVGVPDGLRFPIYFSADIRVYKEFPVHIPFMERSKTRKFRFGFYSTNVTNRANPHDVYNNITSPVFGEFAGLQKRVDGLVLDLVQ